MSARRLLIVLMAYVAFDLADPVMPGAFSFEVDASPIEEAIQANRLPKDTTPTAPLPAQPGRRTEPRDDSLTRQSLAVMAQPLTRWAASHPAPRSALLAPAPSPDDH
jgi:hypothetical protein